MEEQVLTPGGMAPKSQVHSAAEMAATPVGDDQVLTPGGYRPRSMVHHIEPGTVLTNVDGRFQKIHQASGKMLMDYGRMPHKLTLEPLMPNNVFVPAHLVVPSFGHGWICNTGWTDNTGQPITSFSTTWRVPPPPDTQSGQTIFLFNGIQNSTMIFQPVLQWGPSAAGGGNSWQIASWYADGQGGHSFYSQLVSVNPGDELVGLMTQTGHSGSLYSYLCCFVGHGNTALPISNVEQLTWCNETLEAYNVVHASDYPATSHTNFKNISIQTGTTHPTISWGTSNNVTDIGQHVSVISNSTTNGEVDIFYRGIMMAWKGMNNDQTIWYSEYGANNWTNQRQVPGIATSVGPSLSLFNGKVYMAWKGMNNDQGIWYSYYDGASWAAQHQVPGVATSYKPSLAVFNGKLYMAWKGMDNDQGIWFSSFDGTSWAPQQKVAGVATSVGPTLATFNGRLYMAWKGMDNDQAIWWSKFDGTSWAAQLSVPGVATSVGPSLAVYAGRLYMAWKGMNNDQGIWYSYFDGANWAPQLNVHGVATSVGPTLAAYGGNLYMSWKGMNTDQGIWYSTFNGATWAAQQQVSGVSTSVGPGMCSL